MQMSKYVRLTRGVVDKGILIKPEELHNYVKNLNDDYYTSTYYYTQKHFEDFQKIGSVRGIKDVKTDQIWWDFDSEANLKDAKDDTITLVQRLEQYVDVSKVDIFFSGNKGFNVILNLTKELNRRQVEGFALKLARDLKTFDASMYDEPQLLRVPGTKHQKSGYYKIPLTYNELTTLKKSELLAKASKSLSLKEARPVRNIVDINEDLFEVEEVKKELKVSSNEEFDLKNRPKGWKASKWALVQGFFKDGERNTSMLILAATCRGMGYDKLTAYYLCKGALKRSHERYGEGDYSKEELWNQVERVYGDEWQGGQFTVESEPVLKKICDRLGIVESVDKALTINSEQLMDKFTNFAKNIESLTIKTGIDILDKKIRMTVGMAVGLIAPPGAGKTSIALQMLHNMSKQGHQCIFFSYDMFDALLAQKIVLKHTDKTQDEVYNLMQNNNEEFIKQLKHIMKVEYANVEFCFQNGQSIEDIEETIKTVKDKTGKPIKFIVLDYNELVMTEYSDPTQSSAYVAQKIRQLANDHQTCILSLFQPNKFSGGDPSMEIKSYSAAKGSSAIQQSLSIILGMSRPGCTPKFAEDGWDKFATINCLKNRFGGLFSLNLYWDGKKGTVYQMDAEGFAQLKELKELVQQEKNGSESKDEWS